MSEILLYGTVGQDFWGDDCFTAREVADQLTEMPAGPVTVRINSGGGIASEGQAIYSLLRSSGREITVVIDGIAASAASLIAMAGEIIRMPLGAQMMIHDPAQWFTEGRGTEEDHLRAAAGLAVTANAYAAVYANRAGLSTEAARAIMVAETWYDGPAAVAAGFATETGLEEAAAAAVFDYRLYANAPDILRQRQPSLAAGLTRAAAMATMMGTPAPKPRKGPSMAKDDDEMTTTTASGDQVEANTDEDNEEEEMETQTASDGDADPSDDDETDMEASGQDASATAQSDAVAIMDFMVATGRTIEEARDVLARGMTLAQVASAVTTSLQEETPTMAGSGRTQTARVTRDERETRRTGMAMAMAHQISGVGEVDGNARRFMDMSLVEMAAASIGHTGPTRSAGDRIDVFMSASHSTSDFPGIFENALNKILLERYETAEPTYRQIARQRNFRDFRETPLIRTGDFPNLLKVPETGEIRFGTFGEIRETAVLIPYARGLRVSRQMLINDDLNAIDEVISGYAERIPLFEEQTFYSFALTATLASGTAVFHEDHNNLAAAGSAISVESVSEGRAAIRKQKSIDKSNLGLRPSILLVGPDNLTAAEQLVAEVQPTQSGEVNPFSGRLTAVDTPEIAGSEWYLMCGPRTGSPFVWGYLDGAEGPRLRTDEPFGQQGFAATVELDFGMGAHDFRGGWKNPGE